MFEKTLPAKSRMFMCLCQQDQNPMKSANGLFVFWRKTCCDVAFSGCFVTHKLCDTLSTPAAIMGFFRF